jgi:CDP-glucose 4,6-dehydratase
MRCLITGHTGFKGSWLSLLLTQQGHEVHGIALDPIPGSLYERAQLGELLSSDARSDIRDPKTMREAVQRVRPEILVHMAAQPLVRASYVDPVDTMETNVGGTLNVLQAARDAESLRGLVVITTDKVYRNDGRREGYREADSLGGRDPYSASKAMADILTNSWIESFELPPTVIARAGNVVGGGDTGAERLVPDLVRAWTQGQPVTIRNPDSIRPWQHVLDCLAGYQKTIEYLLGGGRSAAFNFGPPEGSLHAVGEVVEVAAQSWGDDAQWVIETDPKAVHEEAVLMLDSSEARAAMGWRDQLAFRDAIEWTMKWERAAHAGANVRELMSEQLALFNALDL